jgi:hypothetical protein
MLVAYWLRWGRYVLMMKLPLWIESHLPECVQVPHFRQSFDADRVEC